MSRPFENDEDDNKDPAPKKERLKNVSSQKSIFDSIPKKPTQQELEQKVQAREEKGTGYKQRASDLALKFRKLTEDKTLPSNRSIFANEMEREVLSEMISLAIEINSDGNELEGMGSLSWITLLFKTSLAQRDRINKLEYAILQMEKNSSPTILSDLITKEIAKALDNKKVSE